MNKLAKTIIGVLVGIIVILIVIIILQASSKNKCKDNITDNSNTSDEVKQLVGIYSYTSTNNRTGTIILNEDMTCSYSAPSKYECKWGLSDNKKEITILLNQYIIAFDSSDKIGEIHDGSDNISTCEEKLKKYTEQYDLVNPRCEYTNNTQPAKATIINGGFILNSLTYYKVG